MDINSMAKQKSLENLMGLMDEDEAKKIPGITISISVPEGMEGEENGEQGSDPLASMQSPDENSAPMAHEAMGSPGTGSSPFEELMKKKLLEQRGAGPSGY